MSDKAFAAIVGTSLVTILIVFFGGLVLLGLSEDIHREYPDGDCVIIIHENRHIFDEDKTTVETFCKE